jgi:hypothetical protein
MTRRSSWTFLTCGLHEIAFLASCQNWKPRGAVKWLPSLWSSSAELVSCCSVVRPQGPQGPSTLIAWNTDPQVLVKNSLLLCVARSLQERNVSRESSGMHVQEFRTYVWRSVCSELKISLSIHYFHWSVAPEQLYSNTSLEVDALFFRQTVAVCISETSVYFNETTRRYIPESCYLQ